MKKILITLAALIMMGATNVGATTQRTSETSKPQTEQVKASGKKVKNNGTLTDRTYKGMPVYKGAKGGLFVIRTSKKTGNEYKQYIKPEKLDPKK